MKAIVYDAYGPPDNLYLQEVPNPVPTDDEVLVKVAAASVNGSDRESLVGSPFYVRIGGLFKPGARILGSDIAGTIEAVGKNITTFKPGDRVFGCLMTYNSGFAEYVTARENWLAAIPDGMSFQQAAALPQGGVIALQAMGRSNQAAVGRTNADDAKVQPGQRVLINGAGGAAGAFAVQLAKLYGAKVTGVDNASKQEFMRSLGADHVIDYAREDFTKSDKQYDLILDVISKRSAWGYLRALKPGGSCYIVGGSVATLFQCLLFGSLIQSRTTKNIRILIVRFSPEALREVAALCESGKLVPFIDKEYPLEQLPDALRYMNDGRAKGKLVINVEPA